MNVILHGFEYRKRCRECPFCVPVHGEYHICIVLKKEVDPTMSKHNKDCPMERCDD